VDFSQRQRPRRFLANSHRLTPTGGAIELPGPVLPSAVRRATIAASLALALAFSGQISGTSLHGTAASVAESYGQLPLAFEQNRGQTDGRVDFLARAPGQSAFLTSTGATLALQSSDQRNKGAAIRLALSGADPAARPVGLQRLPGEVNVLRGDDPSKWVRGAPTFARVRYADVYPGIDLAWHGAQGGKLEYDFTVRPGADPRQIGLRLDGTRDITLTDSGALRIKTAAGPLVQRPPVAYQQIDGHRQPVEARYGLSGSEVHLILGSYDRQRPLVIDPVLVYSTTLGGSSIDQGVDIAIDSQGAAYVTGITESTDFPTTAGAFDAGANGNQDAFVTKLDPAGSSLAYSTYLGGSNTDQGIGIAIDSQGAAYVTGMTSSTDFPTTAGAFDTSKNGGNDDAFVTKLDPAGSSLAYSSYLGGTNTFDIGLGIAVDSLGAAYLTGSTSSTDFPTTAGAFDPSYNGNQDAFATKFDPAGSSLAYSTFLGGSATEEGSGIAVDSLGAAYVTGITPSTDFPTTAGAFDTSYNGNGDAFVTKLDPLGSGLAYSTYLGGSQADQGHIAVDSQGAAYITGSTDSTDFPTTTGAFDTTYNGNRDTFVTKLDPLGLTLAYSTYLGGSNSDEGVGIAVDSLGAAYVTGFTSSTDFPTTAGASDTSGDANGDAFATKVDPPSSSLAYSTYLGGSSFDLGLGVAIDSLGDAFITGFTFSTDFPTTAGAFDTSGDANGDAFVTKLASGPAPEVLTSLSPTHAWIGLKNSDDQGTQFDVLAELLKNGTPVASGLKRCITGVTRNPSLATEAIVPWDTFPPVTLGPGDVLSLRLSTRIGTNPNGTKCAGPGGSHNNAVGLRLYYDSTGRPSRFDWTITPNANQDEYLHSNGNPCANAESTGVTTRYFDETPPTAANAKCKDSASVNFAGGNPLKVIGTWSHAPQP
jgi:hypothetical protein